MSRRGKQQRGRRGPVRKPQGASLVGQQLELDIEDVAHGGHCVARHEGRVLFVRHALPGERVIAEVTSGTDRTSFLRADAVQVLRAADERRRPPCPVSGPGGCGGCDWQHTDAAHGRVLKARVVQEQLRRLAGLDVPVEVEPVPGDMDGLRWRTRLRLAVDAQGHAGLHPHRSNAVLPVADCLIATEDVISSGALQEVYDRGTRSVEVVATSTGEGLVIGLPTTESVPVVRERVQLPDHAHELAVSATGFWQVHPGAASALVQAVVEALQPQPGERVVDLYAGVGLFATELARHVGPTGRVVAVEGDATAAALGVDNLAHAPWASAVHADVQRWVGGDRPTDADLVVLDPPRTGAGRAVLAGLLAGRPRAVAYVACDPAALARDVAFAAELGYRLESLRAFDLFPMTHHVECVALLVPAG